MYNIIENNIQEIILKNSNLLNEHFSKYEQLLIHANNKLHVDEITKIAFKKEFRTFWSMNVARLDEAFYETYFSLTDIYSPIDALHTLKERHNKYQYSFSTKFYHTFINTKAPIYDSRVKLFYLLPDASFENFGDQYSFLVKEYERVLKNNLLKNPINSVRKEFNLSALVTDEKIIDSLIWMYVNAMQKRDLSDCPFMY